MDVSIGVMDERRPEIFIGSVSPILSARAFRRDNTPELFRTCGERFRVKQAVERDSLARDAVFQHGHSLIHPVLCKHPRIDLCKIHALMSHQAL